MTIDLKTKILHDIAYQMKKMLKEWKTSFSCDEKDEEVILEYLNTVEKLILPKPRTVLVSKELQKKIENKNFTEKGQTVSAKKASEIVDDIEYFEDQFKRGRDVNNHLSKQIYNSKCKDILLNTWNIKHIHLNKAEAKSMESMKNNRADFLLFCIVEDSDVLFLDVRRHPNKRGFSSYSLLQIAFNNDWMTHLGFEEVDDYIPYSMETSVYKGYKQDKIEMRGDRAEMSDFPLYLNTVAGGLDRRDQTIGGFSFVVKIYAVPVVEIIG